MTCTTCGRAIDRGSTSTVRGATHCTRCAVCRSEAALADWRYTPAISDAKRAARRAFYARHKEDIKRRKARRLIDLLH
jgi:hypothetical protein